MDPITAPITGTPEAEQPAAPVEPRIPGVYRDDDLVYVDPDKRTVVGFVEFSKNGNPKSLLMKEEEVEEEDVKEDPTVAAPVKPGLKGKPMDKGRRPRVRRQRFYPWGTYRSMKRIYKIEGKVPRAENQQTLDEVMEKALKEPFWD